MSTIDYLPGFPYQIHHLFYYLSYISRFKLTFYNRKASRLYHNYRVSCPFFAVILPAFAIFLFGLRAGIFLLKPEYFDTAEKRLYFFNELFPEDSRVPMEFTMLVASVMHVGYVICVLRPRLVDYRFLAVFLVDFEASKGICQKHLDLTQKELTKLIKFRGRFLPLANLITWFVVVAGFFGSLFFVVLKSLWQINLFFSGFWTIGFTLWALYACDFCYGVPVFMSIILRYIRIKQDSVSCGLHSIWLHHRWHRNSKLLFRKVISINARYNWIVREVKDYNRFGSRFLTLLLVIYTINICYISYSLFLTPTSLDFGIMYGAALVAHVFLLTVIIFTAAAVCKANKIVGHRGYQILSLAYRMGRFTPLQLLKMSLLSQAIRLKRVGFCLANNYTIDYNTYPMVVYFISCFFFLIVQKGSH